MKTMKRTLALLIAMIMVLGMLPVSVMAGETAVTPIYVGGVEMNDGDYLANGATAVSDNAPAEGGYAHYAVVDGKATLTLNDHIYSGAGSKFDSSGNTSGAAINYDGTDTLYLTLEGENSVTHTGGSDYYDSVGISVEGSLAISGTGSLSVSGGSPDPTRDSASYGIYSAFGDVTLSSGSVTAIGGEAPYRSVGISADNVTVSGGDLTAVGNAVTDTDNGWFTESCGIMTDIFSVSGGSVKASAKEAVRSVAVCASPYQSNTGNKIILGEGMAILSPAEGRIGYDEDWSAYVIFDGTSYAPEVEIGVGDSGSNEGGEAEGTTPATLYFVPNSNWLMDTPRFAAYFYATGGDHVWVDLTDADGDGTYECAVPEGYTDVIFCRMNGAITTNNWDCKWNQTADLTIPTDGNNCYVYPDGAWDNSGSGTWSTYVPSTEPEKVTLMFEFNGGVLTEDAPEHLSDYLVGDTVVLPPLPPGGHIPAYRLYKEGYLVKNGYYITGFEDQHGNFYDITSDTDIITINEDTTLTVQWAEITVPADAVEITDTYEGLAVNDLGNFGTYSAENGWTPLALESGNYYYFAIELNEGDTVYFDFSEATQYELYISGDPNPTVNDSETTANITVENGGTYHLVASSDATAKIHILPASTEDDSGEGENTDTTTVEVNLMLKAVDADGNAISGQFDVQLNEGEWVGNADCEYSNRFTVNIGENTLSGWDYCPAGYHRPDYDITFTADAQGNITVTGGESTLEQEDGIYYFVVTLEGDEYTYVSVSLLLKPVDTVGNEIEGSLDVRLNGDNWVGTADCEYEQPYDVRVGENTLSGWDYCPEGYARPDYDITFTADAQGNITITSDNATLEKDGEVNYIIVTLELVSTGGDVTDPSTETVTVYFQNNWLWSDVCIYYWTEDGNSPEWRGVPMVLYGNDGNYDIYSYELPADTQGIIISGIKDDGSGDIDQTPDILAEDIYDGACYYMMWDNGNAVGSESIDVILPAPELELRSASVALGSDISIIFKAHLPSDTVPFAALRITMNGNQTLLYAHQAEDLGGDLYAFTFTGIAPQQMGDELTIELVTMDGNNVTGVWDTVEGYSVKQNAINLMSLYPDDAKLITLLADLLTYGAAAQIYTSYSTDALVTDGLTLTPSTGMPSADDAMILEGNTNQSAYLSSVGLWFDNVNNLYVKVTVADSVAENVTLRLSGTDYSLSDMEDLGGGVYKLMGKALYATDFATDFVFELYYGSDSVATLTYSVNAYAYGILQSDSETQVMKDLALALYRYGVSTTAYAGGDEVITVTEAEITLEQTEYIFSDAYLEPAVTSVVVGGQTLSEGTDYTVSYTNNYYVGDATVTVTFTGRYEGTVSTTFRIIQDPATGGFDGPGVPIG